MECMYRDVEYWAYGKELILSGMYGVKFNVLLTDVQVLVNRRVVNLKCKYQSIPEDIEQEMMELMSSVVIG